MITSIQHFCENGVKRLTNVFKTYTDDLTKIAEMVYGVTDEVTRLGCSMIAEEWESYDELLRERKDLRQGWYIVRRDETSLLTSLGEVVYHKTQVHFLIQSTYGAIPLQRRCIGFIYCIHINIL